MEWMRAMTSGVAHQPVEYPFHHAILLLCPLLPMPEILVKGVAWWVKEGDATEEGLWWKTPLGTALAHSITEAYDGSCRWQVEQAANICDAIGSTCSPIHFRV